MLDKKIAKKMIEKKRGTAWDRSPQKLTEAGDTATEVRKPVWSVYNSEQTLLYYHEMTYLMLDIVLLIFIKMDLDDSGAIQLDPGTLSNNLCRENKILEDVVMYCGQGPAKNEWALTSVNKDL